MKEAFDALAYRSAWRIVRVIPESVAYALFQAVADRAWRKRGKGVTQLENNLRRVVPDADQDQLRELSRNSMRLYMRYWCDSFRIPDWSAERIVNTIKIVNEVHLREALSAEKGCVVALPHVGNWDHAGSWACVTGTPLTTVAERLKPESLFQAFLRYRQELGMEVLASDSDHIMGVLAARLRSGRLVALVADRDLSSTGIVVDFFGEPASLPAGPAALAVQTGAALVPAFVKYLEPRDPSGFNIEVEFFPPVTDPETGSRSDRITAMVTSCASVFEKAISNDPNQWHMLQRYWISDRKPANVK
ncbi:MAG TPA: phosphatidylinositol mannoside acyltransferase [Candidatus Nanopelagicaceae bacterium]|nr:phosphatidylinositol mannoside acyltransferase [Candidatus Nanopelagicaceae bacterium]